MIRKITILGLLLFAFGSVLYAQNFTPVSLLKKSYKADVVAEKYPYDSTSTTIGMDGPLPGPTATNPQHTLYTAALAAQEGALGGLPANRTIARTKSGITHTFLLAPYDSVNAFFVKGGVTDTIFLATPAPYWKLSLLVLSTEQSASIYDTILYTDGTKFSLGSPTITDWYQQIPNPLPANMDTMKTGNGRVARWDPNATAGTFPFEVDGYNPYSSSNFGAANFYYLDLINTCNNWGKSIQGIIIKNRSTNAGGYPCPYVLAVSGIPYVAPTVTLTSTPSGCSGPSGTATITISGGTAGFVLSKWLLTTTTIGQQSTSPATGLPPGRDSAQLVDASGTCKIISPTVIVDSGVMPKPVVASIDTCVGYNVTLSVKNPGTDTTYNWYTVATGGTPVKTGNSYAVPTNTNATYYVEGSITNIAPANDPCTTKPRTVVTVTFEPLLATPVVTIGATTPTSVTFQWAAVPNATSYQVSVNGGPYQTPSSGSTGTSHTVTGTTGANVSISVIAYGKLPCQTSAAGTQSFVIPSNGVFVPKAFTPNGDGLNDVLYVYGNFIQQLDMKIFNQWGQAIFETANKGNGWDGTYKGKMQPSGVYMYALKATLQDGTVVNTKGSINLIR